MIEKINPEFLDGEIKKYGDKLIKEHTKAILFSIISHKINEIIDEVNKMSHLAEDQYWESELARSIQTQEYALFAQLRPLITQDGNQWCVLYGKDLHDGIAGFGDTPYLAVLAFNAEWNKHVNETICQDKKAETSPTAKSAIPEMGERGRYGF